MRETLSLNLYLENDKHLNYSLLSSLYFFDISNNLDLFNHKHLYRAQDVLKNSDPSSPTDQTNNNIENLKSRRIDYTFYSQNTNIFLLLDVSSSILKYDGNTLKIQLDLLEEMVFTVFDNLYQTLSNLRNNHQFVLHPRLSIFVFGFPKSDFLNLVNDFCLDEGSFPALREKLNMMFNLVSEKLYDEVTHITRETAKDFKPSFDSFFTKFMSYFSKNYNDHRAFCKLLVLTDGICFENSVSVFRALQMNNLHMACDIILVGHPNNTLSNDLGFIASEKPLNALAKLLNGRLYSYDEFKAASSHNPVLLSKKKPHISVFLKMCLGITQIIKFIEPGEQGDQKTIEKPNKIKPFEKIRRQHYQSSPLQIQNFHDFLNDKIISSWRICYINRVGGYEKEMVLRIKLGPKLDLLAYLTFQSNQNQKLCLSRVTHYIRGPRYLVSSILESEAKIHSSSVKFNQMHEYPKNDNLLFEVIPNTIMLKYDKDNNRYDLTFSDHAHRVFEIINRSNNWHKYFVAERLVFVFKREFDGQNKKWVLRQKIEELMSNFTNKALSKTLYLKLIVSPESEQTTKSAPVEKFCLIKYKWLTKQIVSFKIGVYSAAKLCQEDFKSKTAIIERILQQLSALDGTRVSNSIINVFTFFQKQSLQINSKFATVTQSWDNCCCLVDLTPFFVNLNHQLTNNLKFICIFSSRSEFQLIYMTRIRFHIQVDHQSEDRQIKDKELFCQISFDKKKKVVNSILFTEPFDAIIDFEFKDKCYLKASITDVMNLLKQQIDQAIKYNMSRISSAHFLHRRSVEWRLNKEKRLESKIFELNQKYYKWRNHHDYEEDEIQALASLKHHWQHILVSDYKDFMIEKHKSCMNFDKIFEPDSKIDSIKLNIFSLQDPESASPDMVHCFEDGTEVLIDDYNKDLRKICDFEHNIESPAQNNNIRIFTKFLVYRKLLIIIAPKKLQADKEPEVEFYLLDIDAIEYPADLQQIALNDEKMDSELLKMIFSAAREIKERLQEDFKKSFSRNVYKVCTLGVSLSDQSLSDAIQYCSKESFLDVDMSDFFQLFVPEFKNLTESGTSTTVSLIDFENLFEVKEAEQIDGEKLKLEVYENIDNLVKVFFKKINLNMYIEQSQPIEYILQNSNEIPAYLSEFIPLSRKINPDPKFLTIKIRVQVEGQDMQTLTYDNFINTCKRVLVQIQNHKIAKVLMRLSLIWEPKEIRESDIKSPGVFYNVSPSPYDMGDPNTMSKNKAESPSSPHFVPNVLRDLCGALEKVMNVLVLVIDMMRFVRPLTSEILNAVEKKLNFLSTKHLSYGDIEVEWLNETSESILIAELLKMKNLTLKKKDKIFYFCKKKAESEIKESLTSLTSVDENIEIPMWFLLHIDKDNKKIRTALHLPPYKGLNYRSLSFEFKDIIQQTVNKVQTLIIMNELRTTLYCPSYLKLGDEYLIKRTNIEDSAGRPRRGIGMGSIIGKKKGTIKKSVSKPNQKAEEGANEPTDANNNKNFVIPLIHRELFPVYERVRKGGINYGFLRNFQISNIENAFLAFSEKEIYILVINEVDNKFYQPSGEDSKKSLNRANMDNYSNLVTAEDVDRTDLLNSKTILVLRVYSMERSKPQAINNFISQIYELLTQDSIRHFANAFLNSVQIRFTASDLDYLSYADRKLVLRYELPHFVVDLEAFLYYFKQKIKKYLFTYMVHHTSNARNSYHKISSASANDDVNALSESFLKSPRLIQHETLGPIEIIESYFEQSEYSFFYNYFRYVNDIQLQDYFGKCLFLMNLNLKKFSKEDNCYKELKKFELNIPGSQHKEEPRLSVSLQNQFSFQDELEKHLKSSEISFIEPPAVLDPSEADRILPESPERDCVTLDFEIVVKGKMNEDKFQIFLTEHINHTIYDYFIENFFVNYHLLQLKPPPNAAEKVLTDKKITPIYNVAYFLDQIVDSMRVLSTSIHHFTIPHICLYNQLFDVFRNMAHMFESAIIDKIGNALKVPIVYFIEQDTGSNEDYKLCAFNTDIMKLSDQYSQMFKYPVSFLKKQFPKISGVFCGLDPESGEPDQEISWTEKVKIFDSTERINSTTLPRNILAQFYITCDEIGLISYNFHEELYHNLQNIFQSLIDWTTKRHQLLQCIMNDRVGLGFTNDQIDTEEKLSRKNMFRKSELGFINELNKSCYTKTQQSADSRKWSDRIFNKQIPLNGSGTSLVLENSIAKTLHYYAKNLYLDLDQQKFLVPFDAIYQKIHNMNLRYACVKFVREYDLQEETSDNKKDMESLILDDEDLFVTDLVSHHIEKFMEAAKTFFKKSKNIIRLKALMKKGGLPDNYKKPLLNSFIIRSFSLSNQKFPLLLIPNKLSRADDYGSFSLSSGNIGDLIQRQNQEEESYDSSVNFINEFFEKLLNEILTNKCFKDYETFFVESTDPTLFSSLEATKGLISVGTNDDYDIRRISKGSPVFGAISVPKEENENFFEFRRTLSKDDINKEDLEKFFNSKARDNIEVMQRSQKLITSTLYMRRVEKTVLFIFKFQILYPFLSFSFLWNTLTENKDKVMALVNREANKIFSHLNLRTIIYDYHISLFKEIITNSMSQTFSHIDLPLTFMHFANYFERPPDRSISVFYGANVSVNPGYLYTKFNATNIWHFMASNHRKYGLQSLVDPSTKSYMFVFVDYALMPIFEKISPEERPKIVFIMHNEDSKKSNIMQAQEKKLYLDQSNLNTEFLHISYFIIYDIETSHVRLDDIKIEVEKVTLEMIRKLRKHFIANLFLNKIMKSQELILSSDELQNLLVHSNATSLKEYDKAILDAVSELNIFDQMFVKHFEAMYLGQIRFFREDHGLMDADEPKKKKEAAISSILLSNKSLTMTLLIQMNRLSCIEDIYLLRTNDDPIRLNKEEIDFFNLLKQNLLMFIWKSNLYSDAKK